MSIRLENISKRYEGVRVVDGLTLEVEDHELFVLLGGSGSGKSTILRMIAGLVVPDSGAIFLHDERVDHLPPQKRGVGYVFQNYSLFRHMTVAGNIDFGMKINRIKRRQREAKRNELLEIVGLGGYGDRFPVQLSGGQQQRVALARALAYEPEVLLLDEPFGALDVKIRIQLRQSLRQIHEKLGVTSILVTHDQEEAFELADRIGVLDHGHLIEVGEPMQLYRRPRTQLVATFLGTANLLVGQVEQNQIRLGMAVLEPPADLKLPEDSTSVRVLFRPEDIELAADRESLAGQLLGRGEISEIAYAGSLQKLTLRVDGLAGTRPVAPQPSYGDPRTRLQAQVQGDGYHPFDLRMHQDVWVGVRSFHVLPHEGLRLLVCLDGSQYSQQALEFGRVLAQAAQGPVTVLGVAEKKNEENRARAGLEAACESLSKDVREIETRFRTGNAAEEILYQLAEEPYDLVVLGSYGRHGPSRSALGSTSMRVAQLANVGILIVPTLRERLNKILICTPTGEAGKKVIRFGGRIARRAKSKVTLLHIVRPEVAEDLDAEERESLQDLVESFAEDHLEKGVRTMEQLGVAGERKFRKGAVVTEILGEANEGDYDLIVVGAPQMKRRRVLLPHDVTSQLIKRARHPILVVPPRIE